MGDRDKRNSTEEFEKVVKDKDRGKKYILTLYIAGTNARTRFAIENIRKVCEEHLEGCYYLEVIDLRDNPELAAKENIVATPTLIKKLPPPLRTYIGNMADTDKILVGLKLRPKTGPAQHPTTNED